MSNNEKQEQKSRVIRCTLCRVETPENEIPKDASCCPSCKTEALPHFVDHDVNVRVNWNDLRILALWAASWESEMIKSGDNTHAGIVDSIVQQLRKYRPEDAAPLSLIEEIEETGIGIFGTIQVSENGKLKIVKKEQLH